MKKKPVGPPKEFVPFRNNPNIRVFYELEVGKDVMVPGTKFKKKYDRDTYQFIRLVHHIEHDTTWVDAHSVSRGSWHSIAIPDIHRVVKPKRSRAKK